MLPPDPHRNPRFPPSPLITSSHLGVPLTSPASEAPRPHHSLAPAFARGSSPLLSTVVVRGEAQASSSSVCVCVLGGVRFTETCYSYNKLHQPGAAARGVLTYLHACGPATRSRSGPSRSFDPSLGHCCSAFIAFGYYGFFWPSHKQDPRGPVPRITLVTAV